MLLSMLLSRGTAGTQDQTEGAGEYRGKNNQIDCKAGTTAKEQNLLANISTSRASLLQGQYNVKLTALKFE